MVFSSVPVYLDHPNWHQSQPSNYQQGCDNQNYQPQPQPPPPQVGGGGGGGGGVGGSIKPGSMVDRAWQARIPQPEAGLKCPRCESTNTKFCYYNNYNLSQPRHFCKTCRRYWTRGGALRSIPVGGGCRKNKRSKSRSSKSHIQVMITSASTPPNHFPNQTPQLEMPFMDSFQNLDQCGGGNMGICGFQQKVAAPGGGGEASLGFQSGSSNFLSAGGADSWRLPFLSGLENFFPCQNEAVEARSTGISMDPVKMVENYQLLGLNLSRPRFKDVSENTDHQFWGGGNQWTDISGLNSSSTSNLL